MGNRSRINNITVYLLSQSISIFGASIVQFAIVWYITLSTKSGVMMMVSTICGFLPQVFVSFFAGVWADHYSRKMIIIRANLLSAISTLALAIFFIVGFDHIWIILVISAIRSLGAGIQNPASGALITQLVPKENLLKINGVNATIRSIIQLASPALSGALLSIISIKLIFLIDVITAFIGISLLSFVKIPKHSGKLEKKSTSIMADLKEGLKYANEQAVIKRLVLYLTFFLILIVPIAQLTPLLVVRVFGDDVWRITIVETAFGGGAVIGGILITLWGGMKKLAHTIASACIVFGIGAIVLGVADNFIVFCAVIIIIGMGIPFFNTPSTTLIQKTVNQDKIGRINGLTNFIISSAIPCGMLFFGPLSDYIRIEWLLIFTGILIVLLGFSLFFDKVLASNS
ncbi:MFS transporter [Lysinibacillus xylanilyticus]|uniref:MFS transporter n=1 Tax=Lysinibacillus xylanilyticus TaxID=582475 RepID=UPI002E214A32|nr:MFS transporter [Lysinibacillus xylanilyticus]